MSALATLIERSRSEVERWRYTDLNKLLTVRASAPSFADGTLPALTKGQARLVFVNGVLQTDRSHFGDVQQDLVTGDAASGYRLHLDDKSCLATMPVELLFVIDDNAPSEVSVKLVLDIGASARLSLIERHLPSATVTVVDTAVTLRDQAKLVHGKIVEGGTHLATTVADIGSGALYENFTLLRGGTLVRNEIEVRLNSEQAQAITQGVMLLNGANHADTTIRIHHNAPHCSSRQVYRTVLDGKARGVFQGKIYVAPDAQKTDGYQLSRALLLSDQAEMDVKPELEIHADDVKCSHGSAMGDLDDNALFYLRARGLSEAQARALLIEAFTNEIFDAVPVEGWRESFRTVAAVWHA